MRNSYDVKLSTLEQNLRKEQVGRPRPAGGQPRPPAHGPQFCFLFTAAWQGRHLHHPHLTAEETEAQRG